MIGIHTPETARERDLENVRADAARAGLTFPILVDDAKENWNRWGNSMWPSVYLIDKHGDIRYWWYGELTWQNAQGEQLLRRRIRELLEED